MNASLKCGLAKIRRKKIPSLLLGICIAITAVLFVNAIILIKELNTTFDKAYKEMNGPQICSMWSKNMISPDIVRQYLDNLNGEFEYHITENTKTVDYIEKGELKLSNGILLELPDKLNENMLSPRLLGDSNLEMPKENEVWITKKMANILGIKVGDELSLRLADESMKVNVVNIVSDPVFGGVNTNVYRMWCGYEQLQKFPLADNNIVSYLEVRFQEYSAAMEADFIYEAEKYFDMPLGDTIYTFDKIKSGYTSTYNMVGAILCFVSVIIAITVIVLTIFLVRSDLEEDIKNIGIYKTLGMTGTQVMGVYLVEYGIIACVGAAAGSILGGVINNAFLRKLLGDVGVYDASYVGRQGYQLFVWICVVLFVVGVCAFSVFKLRNLNLAFAIRSGKWNMVEKQKKQTQNMDHEERKSFELFYAIRGIKNHKKRYVYIASVSLVLGCLIMVCIGCLNAVKNIDNEPEVWGFIQTDIYVSSLENTPVSTIMDELQKDARVDYTYGVNKIYSKYKPDNVDNQEIHNNDSYKSIMTELYELPWNEKIKDKSLYGRRPAKENEVAVGLSLAQEYQLEVGDHMELFVYGMKKNYEITGIFQTLSNYGNVIRMGTNHLDQFLEEGSYGDYMLVLSNSADKWTYAEELNEKYDGKFTFIASKSNGENITGVLVPAVGSIITALLVVTILVTINLTVLLIRREQNVIGLLKAVGMTPWQILRIYLWRNCISAFVGNSIGILLGIFFVPVLLTPYAKLLGLTAFPFLSSMSGVVVAFLLLPCCMYVGTCVVVKAINQVSVKQLVNE